MSNHLEASNHAPLFGDAASTPTGGLAGIGDLAVSKSGESILFTPRGSQGEALAISNIRSSDDVQVLQLVGATQNSTFTLTLGGATTAPIPLQAKPPLSSFVWQATLPRPGSYDVGLAWGASSGLQGTTSALVEVFGAGKLLGSATIDQSQPPGASTDVAVPGVGTFRPVGSFNFFATDIQVRLSGPANPGQLLAGAVRVAPTGSTNPGDAGYVDPDPYRASGSDGVFEGSASVAAYGGWARTSFYTQVGSWHGGYYGTPAGTAGSGFPTTSDVTKALSGLAGVAPGSLAVSAPTNQSIVIQFTGPMGGKAWPTLVSSEPAIQVVHDGTAGSSIGGDYPAVTINGVSHDLKAVSFAAGKSLMALHLIQDAPALQYQRYGEGLYQNVGYYNVRNGLGFGGRVAYAPQGGTLASWQYQGLAGPAQFQVDITWPGGDPAADVLECDVLDGSGTVLATVTGIDQSKAPADSVDANGVAWKSLGRFTLPLPVNSLVIQAKGPGNAGKYILLDSTRLTRLSADQGAKVQPGDSVLFHMPPDYVRTATGPVAAISGAPVAPAGATRLPAIPQVPKQLRLGYNCDYPAFWGNDSCYANLAVQAQTPFAMARDARGNPTQLSHDQWLQCGANTTIVSILVGDAGGRGFGVPTCDPGVWVVQWTGSPFSSCALDTVASSTTVAEITSRRTTKGTVSRRYYQVSTSDPGSPNLLLRFLSTQPNDDGSYLCDVSNVAIFPPDVDPDSPSRWRPSFLKKLRGMQCFRFMDMLGTNVMNLADFSHLPDQANFPLGYTGRNIQVPIASIGPPTADPFSEYISGTVVRVTTKVPHGLTTGFAVSLRTSDGTSLGQVQGNVIDPATGLTTATARDPLDPTDGYQGQSRRFICHVIDDVTVQIGMDCYSGPVARMSNTLTPANGILEADVAPNTLMGPADIADLCTATGLEPWVNVPWLATDDCVARMATALAAGLPAGRVVHLEYGNEPWNFAFPGCNFCIRMARLLGLPATSYVAYYMTRMGQVHAIFRAAWAAAGRDPAQVRRVCGVQQDYAAATTAPSLEFAVANGITFDELAPACYYSNTPASGPLDDLLTREQLLDLFAMNLQQSEIPGYMAAHMQACRDALAKYPAQAWIGDVVLVNYEGGPDTMTTATMTANIASRNHAVHRHPDFCEIQLNHLQMLEDAGVKLFNSFTLYGTRSVSQWGVYEGYAMEAGTGDATVDLANVNDFENLREIKSETAAALMKWSALVQQPASPASPAALVLRNGVVGTYGRVAY